MKYSAKEDYGRFYVLNSSGLPYDLDYPFVVVNSENEPVARFHNTLSAEMFLIMCYEGFGRIVDTRT